MWGLRSSRTVVVVASVVAFLVFCVLPSLYMLDLALPMADSALIDRRQWSLLFNTMSLGAGTATLATAVGAPLGFFLARVPFPCKMTLRLALIAPALLPPYVVALAWIYLDAHVRSSMWHPLAIVVPDPYSLPGAIGVLAVAFYPITMLATEVGLRRLEPRLEEAALLAAAPARALRGVTLPLVAPNVLAAALVTFVLAISEFSVPGLLRVRVFTTEVFTAFAALYDFARATALALPLLVVSLAGAAVGAILARGRIVATRRGGSGPPPIAFTHWTRPALAAVAGVAAVALLLPMAALALEALKSNASMAFISGSGDAVTNSLVLAFTGATCVTAVAVGAGYARARASQQVGTAVDAMCLVLFAVPSTIVGIGLIGVWNRAGAAGSLYGTSAMLVLGYLARFLPVATLAMASTIRTVPPSHEEAAMMSGARWLVTMRRIVVPQIRAGVAAVWVISFILAFGEVGTSILVAPPGESTLPIRVYTLTANAPPGQIATLALFQALVVLCPLMLLGVFVRADDR